jgi:hypothetical protein
VGDACRVLNSSRCESLIRCGLLANNASAREACVLNFEATWCGPSTWPSYLLTGGLRYSPLRAQSCADALSTQRCATWETLPAECANFLQPILQLGQSCFEGYSGCAEGVCRGNGCPRVCQAPALVDEPCSRDDECQVGLFCKPVPLMPSRGQCARYGTLGAACVTSTQCAAELSCVSQRCERLPAPGQSCLDGRCNVVGFCTADAGQCVNRRSASEPCDRTFECTVGLVCDLAAHQCVPEGVEPGQPCAPEQQCPPGFGCRRTDGSTATSCEPDGTSGQPCLTSRDCEPHLMCGDADGGRRCQGRLGPGSVCTSNADCQLSASCQLGQCVELPLPGASCSATRQCRWGLCRDFAASDAGAICGLLLGAGQPCGAGNQCASGTCESGTCLARCLP